MYEDIMIAPSGFLTKRPESRGGIMAVSLKRKEIDFNMLVVSGKISICSNQARIGVLGNFYLIRKAFWEIVLRGRI